MLVPDEAAEPPITTYDVECRRAQRRPRRRSSSARPTRATHRSRERRPIATFALASDDPLATFQCALDGAAVHRVPGPVRVHRPAPGQHILRVRAVDIACNVDASPAIWTWTVVLDTTRARRRRSTPPASSAGEGEPSRFFGFTRERAGCDASSARSTTSRSSRASRRTSIAGPAPGHAQLPRPRDRPRRQRRAAARRRTTSRSASTTTPPETTLLTGAADRPNDDWASFDVHLERARRHVRVRHRRPSRSRSASTRRSSSSSSPASTPSRCARSTSR